MVHAYHVIFTAYGFWLPNDPRGSWSDYVRSWELFLHGAATKIDTRQSVAHVEHDRQARLAAKGDLRYPPVSFTGEQARAIGRGFAEAVAISGYTALAGSILPKHTHMVLTRHKQRAEMMVGHFKTRATQRLTKEGIHPFLRFRDSEGNMPCIWAHQAWKVFLDNADDIARAIAYVQDNPVKDGLRPQRWSFVTPWDGTLPTGAR